MDQQAEHSDTSPGPPAAPIGGETAPVVDAASADPGEPLPVETPQPVAEPAMRVVPPVANESITPPASPASIFPDPFGEDEAAEWPIAAGNPSTDHGESADAPNVSLSAARDPGSPAQLDGSHPAETSIGPTDRFTPDCDPTIEPAPVESAAEEALSPTQSDPSSSPEDEARAGDDHSYQWHAFESDDDEVAPGQSFFGADSPQAPTFEPSLNDPVQPDARASVGSAPRTVFLRATKSVRSADPTPIANGQPSLIPDAPQVPAATHQAPEAKKTPAPRESAKVPEPRPGPLTIKPVPAATATAPEAKVVRAGSEPSKGPVTHAVERVPREPAPADPVDTAGATNDPLDYESQADPESLASGADDELQPASSGGIWTIPILCAGLGVIACCLLIPLCDSNRRVAYERVRLQRDLESLQHQVSTNQQFLHKVADDPTLGERLAQRQLHKIRAGTKILPLPDEAGNRAKSGSPATAFMTPFQIVSVPPPTPLAAYQPVGGRIANLCYDSHSRLYLLGGGLMLLATGLVMEYGPRKR